MNSDLWHFIPGDYSYFALSYTIALKKKKIQYGPRDLRLVCFERLCSPFFSCRPPAGVRRWLLLPA